MKAQRRKSRSEGVLLQKSEGQVTSDVNLTPYDSLVIKVLSIRLSDDEPKLFAMKVTFFDQLLVHSIIRSIGPKDEEQTNSIASGTMNYDPSDYEKMCLFADAPLVVHIQPLKNIDDAAAQNIMTTHQTLNPSDTNNISSPSEKGSQISSCNIDILSIFLGLEGEQKMCVKKRMEPMIKPSMMYRQSWDTLPLLTMEIMIERNADNKMHHKVLNDANWMKLTLVASYNMFVPYDNEYVYTAASKTPLYGDSNVGLVTYSQGYREPQRFNCTNFYPKWESLRAGGDFFTRSDQKLQCKIEDIQNDDNIDLPYYLNRILPYHTSVWGSFHRTLMLKDSDKWLWKHLRNYRWPFEVHIYGESGGYSFMAFLNLFQLLYPGEDTVRLAVPLQWINGTSMMRECGCDLLLTPNDRPPSTADGKYQSPTPHALKPSKSSKVTTDSLATSMSTFIGGQWKPTGADDNDAFVVVEVKLGRPLKAIVRPPRILKDDLSAMLKEMESEAFVKRICSGRGQLERDWHKTVKSAALSLRKVPYYGTTEFCTFNRQLSETRTRVELTTSCWQDAAIFINNNFVVQQYLHSDEVFEELVMIAHACLMKSACGVLIPIQAVKDIDPAVLAARHARQMQDTNHAIDLFLTAVVEQPRNASHWRELSTCLKDLDRDWAIVCLNNSVVLNPRNPLTLISKGALLFEDNPTTAEPFFMALLAYYPTWFPAWAIASAYFYERELFHLADRAIGIANQCRNERIAYENEFSRFWERELGDWWDSTPILPGMNLFFDAADLLLRLRAIPLAEVCLARALAETGESAAYYHLVGLCCRLRGDYTGALCHLNTGLQKFGEISYLRTLEAECQHRLGNVSNAIESFGKAGCCVGAFSILMSLACGDSQRTRKVLVDLVRRQPSAYAWTALAEDWVMKMVTSEYETVGEDGDKSKDQQLARTHVVATAIQALKMDRQAGRTWALLGRYVRPKARRAYCFNMAVLCGCRVTEDEMQQMNSVSQMSFCHQVGTQVRECRCHMCDKMRL